MSPLNPVSAGGITSDFLKAHEPQLKSNGIPELYWEALCYKLKNEIFDAGLHFQLQQVQYEDSDETGWNVAVSNPDGVLQGDSNSIFLVDHAWTYDMTNAHTMLSNVDGLAERMCQLMDCEAETDDKEAKVNSVLENMWQYNQTYSFSGFQRDAAEAAPVWYVLDEFGSRIQHSDDPSIKMVPFFYADTNTAYSVFWLLRDLREEDEVTRDFMPHIPLTETISRQAHLLPWMHYDFSEANEEVEEPGADYFKLSRFGGMDFTLVNEEKSLPTDKQILVWTNHHVLVEYLTHDRFKLTDCREEADIIWQLDSIKDFRDLSERNVFINQFPYEELLTVKDLLSIVARRAARGDNSHPRWFPTTYNLNTDLPEFIAHFQKREEEGADNHWIAKPWNMGRGLGHVITKNVSCLTRLPEAGPFIAMKYIEDPVLFYRPDVGKVKFDYRYEIHLKSVKPLKMSCRRTFFIRFANKAYSLDSLHVYEKHFTVHNYSSPEQLLNINCEDFVPEWDRQYPLYPWADIEADTMQCLKELFEAATSKDPPYGVPNYGQSRALYAIDIMLKWDTDSKGQKVMVPQILECNFTPDSKRGCKNYNDYFNHTFKTLFLDDSPDPDGEIIVS
ncbi:tubulin--tyrosine ligase-like protein 12 [Watersipora subatra]|uniref:tubulin--tyrosine ligase-like protein 12 n=1 Tax=Watersipora subatra TaxID=2589382 RepID=UPI00355B77A2